MVLGGGGDCGGGGKSNSLGDGGGGLQENKSVRTAIHQNQCFRRKKFVNNCILHVREVRKLACEDFL